MVLNTDLLYLIFILKFPFTTTSQNQFEEKYWGKINEREKLTQLEEAITIKLRIKFKKSSGQFSIKCF